MIAYARTVTREVVRPQSFPGPRQAICLNPIGGSTKVAMYLARKELYYATTRISPTVSSIGAAAFAVPPTCADMLYTPRGDLRIAT